LEAYYILTLFSTFHLPSISDAETLVFEALEHFKHFDDPDLKCMISDYWYIATHMNSSRQIVQCLDTLLSFKP
jgi:hypothetical protein